MPLTLRLAVRDLRGSLRNFRVLMACLALGVFAIAAAGSTRQAVESGIAQNAQILLGGDLEVSQTYQALDSEQRAALLAHGQISEAQELRVMARTGVPSSPDWRQSLAELKAVDAAYPLFGAVQLSTGQALPDALAQGDGGVWGAVMEPALATRLNLQVGQLFHLGDAQLRLTALITEEPGRGAARLAFGPRLMIALPALPATGLLQLGSLVREVVTVKITDGLSSAQLAEALKVQFPHAAWSLRLLDDASPGVKRTLDSVALYLTLVGLTALLVGGLGVANAIQAYLQGRIATIATLKTLGASSGRILAIYGVQVALLSAAGVGLGLVAGALVPVVAAPLLASMLPVPLEVAVYPLPLLNAATFGLLIALVFALWPLLNSRRTPAAALFRSAEGGDTVSGTAIGWQGWVTLGLACLALIALTLATSDRLVVAAGFIVGSLGALALFRLVAQGLMALARRATDSPTLLRGRPGLRMALSSLYRPGTQTPSLVVSLGLGVSVLVTIALIEANLTRQITETLPAQGPAYYFIDIQPDQREPFLNAVAASPQATLLDTAGIVRGRISALKGQPVDIDSIPPDVQWAVRGDRALTSAVTLPEGAHVSAGQWWPTDYAGPPLLSLAENLAKGLGVTVGDSVTVNILGRDITATIANLRDVQWSSLSMNFAVILSPGTLNGAPLTWIASVAVPPAHEEALQRAVAEVAPNASSISVRQALAMVADILHQAGLAVRSTALVTLLSGALVLGGALAAGQRRRRYEAVVLKVLGAVRRDVLRAHGVEYGLIGLSTGVLSLLIGSLASWAVMEFVMKMPWAPMPGVAAVVVVACTALVAGGGLWATARALQAKAAPLLRHE